MDFLLVLIRKFLYTNSVNTKVILMSATIDTEKFQNYFKTNCADIDIYPPTLHILKESKFDNQLFYIDQLSSLGKIPNFSIAEPRIDKSLYDMLLRLIKIFDRLDKKDVITNRNIVGSVLVFLPGIYEIEEAYNYLTSSNNPRAGTSDSVQWYILPLHSSITNEEQRKAFTPPQPGFRKIILSTNIAESSITVPDITYEREWTEILCSIFHYENLLRECLQLPWYRICQILKN
ncbi:Helicase conserved C-terminal domain [Popillia japonica]|uniref:Helicase conserved C-terminal domain n=1 Tax=Popillia japonica TaxID=7064 RepID=A0AAW1ITZ0_POPJA